MENIICLWLIYNGAKKKRIVMNKYNLLHKGWDLSNFFRVGRHENFSNIFGTVSSETQIAKGITEEMVQDAEL